MSDRDLERRVVGPGFHDDVYALVRTVPAGRVTTYGDVATVLGSPRVARHVGWALAALGRTPRAVGDEVPWHRVINGRGAISYKGDTERGALQEALLAAEGVALSPTGRVEGFAALRWTFPDVIVGQPTS